MKRILIDFAGIGDLVMLVPLLRKLADDAELDLVTRPWGPGTLADQSFLRKVYGLNHPNRGKRGLGLKILGGHRRELGRVLAARGYDEVFTFEQERPVINDWVQTWSSGAALRVMNYPEKQADRVAVGLASQDFDASTAEPGPRLEVAADKLDVARARCREVGARVVGVQVGSGPLNLALKRRPDVKGLAPERMAGLVTYLLESDGADAVVFTGTARERKQIRRVVDLVAPAVRSKAHDWSGRFSLSDVGATLKAMHAFISVDTGPAHMAAAVGCPLLVFFGPSDPAAYAMRGPGMVKVVEGAAPCQYCAGTARFRSCEDNRCMKSITHEQAVNGWSELLDMVGPRACSGD